MVAPKVSWYEESRRKRLEENKKRMEALRLHHLSHALRNSPSPKPFPVLSLYVSLHFYVSKSLFLTSFLLFLVQMKHTKSRLTKEKHIVVVRRSSRVANLPSPVYKEVSFLFLLQHFFSFIFLFFVFQNLHLTFYFILVLQVTIDRVAIPRRYQF